MICETGNNTHTDAKGKSHTLQSDELLDQYLKKSCSWNYSFRLAQSQAPRLPTLQGIKAASPQFQNFFFFIRSGSWKILGTMFCSNTKPRLFVTDQLLLSKKCRPLEALASDLSWVSRVRTIIAGAFKPLGYSGRPLKSVSHGVRLIAHVYQQLVRPKL